MGMNCAPFVSWSVFIFLWSRIYSEASKWEENIFPRSSNRQSDVCISIFASQLSDSLNLACKDGIIENVYLLTIIIFFICRVNVFRWTQNKTKFFNLILLQVCYKHSTLQLVDKRDYPSLSVVDYSYS
jgi:hypothetical protein